MTEIARYNFQRGVPENRLYSGTRYDIESPLDEYIVAHKKLKQLFEQRRKEKQEQQELEKYIQEQIEKGLEEAIEKSLVSALKQFR